MPDDPPRPAAPVAPDADTVPAAPPSDGAAQPQVVGAQRYELHARLAGAAHVVRGRDPELGRDVAIKIIDLGDGAARVADAGAVATLRHPAIVPVFDVVVTDAAIHVVMPLLPGGTLAAWLAAAPRPWRDVLARFVTAGGGLVAAHAAGVVHGRVDAAAMLLGAGGEVLVGGFARAGRAPTAVVDAAEDQRAFCAALAAALDDRSPPAWLVAAVERGRAPEPRRRWPSMAALLQHIATRQRRPRRLAVAAGLLAVAGTAVTVAVIAGAPPASAPCADPRPRLAGVWDAATRAGLEAAFAATKAPYAADAVARVVPALDAYAERWRAAQLTTCQATHVAHTQPPDVLDRRMSCLERRRVAMRTHTAAFVHADARLVERATELVTNLPSVDDCADVHLAAAPPLPGDPVARARIEALARSLDEVEASGLRGLPSDFLTRAQAIAAETSTVAYPPLRVRALELVNDAENANELPEEATLRELARVAAQAGDDALLASAWSRLVLELSVRGRLDEATQLDAAAEAAVARAGRGGDLVYRLELARAARASSVGDLTAAVEHLRAALAVAPNPSHRQHALTLLGGMAMQQGRFAEGLAAVDEALAIVERHRGRHHPAYAEALVVQATILKFDEAPGALDRADAALREARAIREAAFGESHIQVARVLVKLAENELGRGKADQAEAMLRRALPSFDEARDAVDLAGALATLGDVVSFRQAPLEALPIYERALQVAGRGFGVESLSYARVEGNLASEYVLADDCAKARPHAEHVAAAYARAGNPSEGLVLQMLGECDLKEGKIDDGLRRLEQALVLCAAGCGAGNLPGLQAFLGQSLVEYRRDRRRGVALVRTARATFAQLGRADAVLQLDTWLRQQGR